MMFESVDWNEGWDLVAESCGVGVQSMTMTLLALAGEIKPLPDALIFSDTQIEPPWVYEQLRYLQKACEGKIPVIVTSVGNLAEDWLSGQQSLTGSGELVMGAAIPFFVADKESKKPVQWGMDPADLKVSRGGMASRSCTGRYKIGPVKAAARELLGLKKGEQAQNRFNVQQWIGISTDECDRAKPSPPDCNWTTHRWPLIELGMSRQDCIDWMVSESHPLPRRSSCTICPYHSNEAWREIKACPEAWEQAVESERRFQEEGRFISAAGSEKGLLRGVPYLHRSRKPLDEVDFSEEHDNQLSLWTGECEGMCGL